MKADALARVLAATAVQPQVATIAGGMIHVHPDSKEAEALTLTLAWVADLCANYRILGAPMPAKKRDEVSDAFMALSQVLIEVAGSCDAPPTPPSAWLDSMFDWMAANAADAAAGGRAGKRGPRPATSEGQVFRLLLSFYEVVFSEPGGDTSGPTVRFIQAFFAEMHAAFRGATWAEASPNAPELSTLFLPLGGNAARHKVRQYRDATERAEELRLVAGIYELLLQQITDGPALH